MASTIYRLTSLFVIFNMVLPEFGSALLITTHRKYNQNTTDNDLNVTCVADGPNYTTKSVEMIQIKRHGQDIPITTILVQNTYTMEADIKENMEAVGHIDNYSGKSYLTLIIKNHSVEDAGLYRCLMIVREGNVKVTMENATTHDILDAIRKTSTKTDSTTTTPTTTTPTTTTPTTTTPTTTTPTTTTSSKRTAQATIPKECVKITKCPKEIKRFCKRWKSKARRRQRERCGDNIIENE